MFVYFSVRLHISETTQPNVTNFCACCSCSVLFW